MNSKKMSLMGMIVAAVLLPAVGAQAVVRYVALDGSGTDGQAWATAYKTIQAAINDPQMAAGGEIHVKAGVYAITDPITVSKAVLIYGGYSGAGDTRNWTSYQTSVDGGGNAAHCFDVTANATIDGFGILEGHAVGNIPNGGGVRIMRCAATISNCVFKYNDATGFGGAIATYMASGTRIMNCSFTQNTTKECGGAIFHDTGIGLQISNCTFTQNGADDSGGAIHNLSSTVTITKCVFQGNRAAQQVLGGGGAILNEESPATITTCVFTANRAPYGVGIFNYLSSVTIDGCLFEKCDPAALEGGGIYNNGGAPTIKNCLFQLNSVRSQGGGLMNDNTPSKIIDCIFWKNAAAYGGGGIYVAKGSEGTTPATPQFINCTIYGNTTDWRGGGVGSDATPSTWVNCIVWGNEAVSAYPGVYVATASSTNQPTAQYCDIQGEGTYPGTGNLNADPRLMDPANNDFGLAFDSPCIDTGNNTAILGVVTDYEEVTRMVDGNGDGAAVVDMGACELQGQPDHLTHGEIMQSAVYDDVSDTTPTYTFLLRLETDDVLTSVEFQAPAGGNTVYKIPADSHTSVGGVETYHRANGRKHVWEYWAKGTSPSVFTPYGDGIYHVTAKYRDGTQAQLQVAYVVPGSSSAMPLPSQKPQITFPTYGGSAASPVIFTWNACTDGAANSVRLTIIDVNDTEVSSSVLSATATQSGECSLAEGNYEAELAFANLYDVAGSDTTPFQVGKTALVRHLFAVPYTAVYRFYASSVNANFYTISVKEKNRVLANWPDYWTFKGIAFNAWAKQSSSNLAPVYRFWSGRSHFFTIDETERQRIIKFWPDEYTYEGIAFYAYPP